MGRVLLGAALAAAMAPGAVGAQHPSLDGLRPRVERMVPDAGDAGMVVGVREADGSRRVLVVRAPGRGRARWTGAASSRPAR